MEQYLEIALFVAIVILCLWLSALTCSQVFDLFLKIRNYRAQQSLIRDAKKEPIYQEIDPVSRISTHQPLNFIFDIDLNI